MSYKNFFVLFLLAMQAACGVDYKLLGLLAKTKSFALNRGKITNLKQNFENHKHCCIRELGKLTSS